ncbi:GntR family transcriptional regulator [Saccharomonospora sp. CUA-673]|uniref:GntR family transcriptional regulator n=1 Tax=Saccharomonospora sp. CUA-673 TaxID=1904969 RepID=UPI00096503CA|nr:GntR family transcriptional regulator [Saccharomonospora sp. CUA-673]OLT42648.1 GntR family transcriptional regulator [Saccharomonospora sp. CUA-673]
MGVDRSTRAPLHQQVADTLRQEILGHDIAPGDALPSEAALCERFGVARSVVRQAVAGLAADGLVTRRQGRPTIVAPPTEYRRLVQRATGMFEQFARRGHALRTTVRELVPADPPTEVREFLGTADALRLERVRLVDEEPLSYVRTWLPTERVPGLAADDLTDASLHRLLSRVYGLRPMRGARRVHAVAADDKLAAELRVDPGGPLLLLEGGTTDQNDRPLEWFSAWHRADRVAFDIDVSDTMETRLGSPAGTVSEPEAQGAASAPRGSGGSGAPGGPDLDRADLGPAELNRARTLLAELQRILG